MIWKSKDHLTRAIEVTDTKAKQLYADEPLADEEWRAHYEEEMKMERKLEEKLTKRLRGTQKVRDWQVAKYVLLNKETNDTWSYLND